MCGHHFFLHHKANFHPRHEEEGQGCVMVMSDVLGLPLIFLSCIYYYIMKWFYPDVVSFYIFVCHVAGILKPLNPFARAWLAFLIRVAVR